MEAIRALIAGDLPPAGNAIALGKSSAEALPLFEGYYAYWVDSGTSALALALLAAKQRQSHIDKPEVIIPAYCCPDLVAAADYAGVRSVVVDIDNNDPALDLVALSAAINKNTIAVIAVNFLGIRERLPELGLLLQQHPQISLIEDNAQWFPDTTEFANLAGDFVIFSFGRGKPLSLLGGGLLLAKRAQENADALPQPSTSPLVLKLKYLAYNLLLIPQFYQLLNRNPFITLGETRYHPLTEINAMDDFRSQLLPENFKQYSCRQRDSEDFYDAFFAQQPRNYLTTLASDRRKRLLRYPLLLRDKIQRDTLISLLQQSGLGATGLYQQALVDIDGMKDRVICYGNYHNATDFANRFITLPLHEGVTPKHLARIAAIINTLD